jgi:hypothetical protein
VVLDADQVGARVPVDVGGLGEDALAGGEEARLEGDRAEAAVTGRDRGVRAGAAEADEVRAAVAGDVDNEPPVYVDPPALVVAEVVDHEPRREEGAAAGGHGGRDAGVAEPDDVGRPVAGDVGHHPDVPVERPTLVGAEAGDDEAGLPRRGRRRRTDDRRAHQARYHDRGQRPWPGSVHAWSRTKVTLTVAGRLVSLAGAGRNDTRPDPVHGTSRLVGICSRA